MATQKEIRKANKLLGKNKKLIDERFGGIVDADIWFKGCDLCNLAVILNDLINKFVVAPATKK